LEIKVLNIIDARCNHEENSNMNFPWKKCGRSYNTIIRAQDCLCMAMVYLDFEVLLEDGSYFVTALFSRCSLRWSSWETQRYLPRAAVSLQPPFLVILNWPS